MRLVPRYLYLFCNRATVDDVIRLGVISGTREIDNQFIICTPWIKPRHLVIHQINIAINTFLRDRRPLHNKMVIKIFSLGSDC